MEEEAIATTRYWCHMCSRTVDPLMEAEIKCPFCASGFVEEMPEEEEQHSPYSNTSLLMQLINEAGNDEDSQLQETLRRRGRRSVSVIRLLHGAGAVSTLEPESNGDGGGGGERGRVIMIQSSVAPAGSLSEYFIGPGFEALLQRLAENDPNRYGTPPARKEAVEALASVKMEEDTLQCSVCLDDFEIGMEAKEMPCKHKFHGDCLLPWLELHSSCPVCRYQLPSDDSKTESATTEPNGVGETSSSTSSQGSENSDGSHHSEQEEEESDEGEGLEFSIPWLFSRLFSSSQGSSNPSTDTN